MHMRKTSLLPWIIWSLAALTFCLTYIVRMVPATMVNTLMQEFRVPSLEIGTLSAYLLYSYVIMQIPVGVIVDRYGVRLALGLATGLCAATTYSFASTDLFWVTQVSRVFFGIGMAFSFIGALKLAVEWIPKQYFSVVVGITESLGMLGAASSAAIMGRCVHIYGWRNSLTVFAIILAILTIAILLIVHNKPNANNANNANNNIFSGLKTILIIKQTWILAIFLGLAFVLTITMEMWGSFFLSITHNISNQQANDIISVMYICMALGCPLAGILANIFGRRIIMLGSAMLGVILAPIIIFATNLNCISLYLLLGGIGFTSAGAPMAYTSATEIVPKELSGLTIGFVNTVAIGIGAGFIHLIGAIIHHLYTQHSGDIMVIKYGISEVQPAMSIIILAAACALIISLFIKETLPRTLTT